MEAWDKHDTLGSSSVVRIKKLRQDINKKDLIKSSIKYWLDIGKTSRARCRSCGQKFDKEDVRIVFKANFEMAQVPQPSRELNLCFSSACLSNVPKAKDGSVSFHVCFAFNNWFLE